MEFDYYTLQLLRENTILDPISYYRVLKLRDLAMECKHTICQLENCDIEADFSKANQLEGQLRFKIWCNKMYQYWAQHYAVSYELEDFALYALYQQDNKKSKTR